MIQAEGANALVRTMREAGGKSLIPCQAETRALPFASAIRRRGRRRCTFSKHRRSLRTSQRSRNRQAKAEIGAEGIGCEPASAVTLAGLKKLVKQRFVKPEETVVLVLTGNLLKDPDFTIDFHRGDLFKNKDQENESASLLDPLRRPPMVLDATLEAVMGALARAEKS